jgi:hypothetical protein
MRFQTGRRALFRTAVVLAVLASLVSPTSPGAVASVTNTISDTTPVNISGNWIMADTWTLNGGVVADTTVLKQTSPGVYRAEHASDPGSITTNIPISESSFDYWSCDSVGTYNQSNESSCPTGWFDETWNLDLSKIPYTAKGTFEGFNVLGTILAKGTFTAYLASGPPSVAVSISPKSSTVAVGEKVNVTVTVKAGTQNLKSVNLFDGLNLSPKGAAVVQAPPGLNGFTLAAFAVRRFVFRLTGAEPATVSMSAFATATSASGGIHGSAEAQLSIGNISDYTINVQASIPQDIVVDPSTEARYNTTSDNGQDGYNHETPFLKRLIGKELEYPECLSASEVAEDTEKNVIAEWYSYYLGPTSLGKITIPLQWDESTQEVTLGDSIYSVTGQLTRVFKYRLGHVAIKGDIPTVVYDTPQEECEETVPVRMLVAPVAGGNNLEMAGDMPSNAFTIVAAWEFPFAPAGARVNPERSFAQRLAEYVEETYGPPLEELLGSRVVELLSSAPEVYEANTPGLIKFLLDFAISYYFLSGAVGLIAKAPAAIAEANAAVREGAQLTAAELASIEQYAGLLHTAGEYGHYAKAIGEILEGLEQLEGYLDAKAGAYPIMASIIRGKFTTEYGVGPEARTAQKTLLAVSVKTTKFPNIWLTVTRKTQPAATGSAAHPFNGVLPWSQDVGARPVSTRNPFASNPPGLVNDSTSDGHSYMSGEEAVKDIISDTSQTPAVTNGIRSAANLDSEFAAEQADAPEPSCNADGEAPLGDTSTICWLIYDGSGPADHRA